MSWWKLSFIVYIIRSFLFFSFIGVTQGRHHHQQLCNSSCGGLSIQYPFRLKGDPINCGEPNYELTCSSNKTLLEVQSVQFLVREIGYADTNFLRKGYWIKIVELGLLRSNCSLPLKSFTPSVTNFVDWNVEYFSWISLINCSKKLTASNYQLIPNYQLITDYQLIPCLSKEDSYVYGVYGDRVSDLAPSCSFLTMMPAEYENTSSGHSDLLQVIHDGFYIRWVNGYSTIFNIIKYCLQDSWGTFTEYLEIDMSHWRKKNTIQRCRSIFDAVFHAETKIPSCIKYNTHLSGRFRLIFFYMLFVVIDIVQLVIVLQLIGRLVFAPLTLCIYLAHKFWTIWSLEDAVEKFLQAQQSLSPIRYTYAHIIAITRHFKEQLGRGGFGSVYKGELPGGHFVAVKLLAGNSKCSGDDFISEVSTIGRIHHLNVVRLVGFCSEGSKRALIYEFMPNKSLDKYIFSSNRYFTWQKLNNIAMGMARGIDYLHRGCDMTILHFDIKPQNILLDQSFVPKIADFGLAKLYPKEYNAVSVSAARGTIGYIAPELVSRNFGVISHKSDVYSFGMMLMEMAAGRKNVERNAGSSSQNYYPSLIYDRLNNDVKEGIEIESFEMNEVEKKLCLVGLWCIQIRPIDRPSMSQVMQMLEGHVKDLEFPPKPFFSCSSSIPRTLRSSSTATVELAFIDEDDSS